MYFVCSQYFFHSPVIPVYRDVKLLIKHFWRNINFIHKENPFEPYKYFIIFMKITHHQNHEHLQNPRADMAAQIRRDWLAKQLSELEEVEL